MAFCGQCGAPNADGAAFCGTCGAGQAPSPEPPPTQEVPAAAPEPIPPPFAAEPPVLDSPVPPPKKSGSGLLVVLLAGGAVVFLLVAAAGVGGYWWFTHRERPSPNLPQIETPAEAPEPPAQPMELPSAASAEEAPAEAPPEPVRTEPLAPPESPRTPPKSRPASPPTESAPLVPALEPLPPPESPAAEPPPALPVAPPDALGRPCAGNREFVESLFRSIHDREPDEAGTAYWVATLEQGGRREDAYRGFFSSKEYLSRKKSDRDYVRDLYQACLSREPDPAGMDGWLGFLAQEKKPKKQQVKRDELLNSTLGGQEYLAIRRGC